MNYRIKNNKISLKETKRHQAVNQFRINLLYLNCFKSCIMFTLPSLRHVIISVFERLYERLFINSKTIKQWRHLSYYYIQYLLA